MNARGPHERVIFGRFVAESVIAQSGSTLVFAAADPVTGEQVVVKTARALGPWSPGATALQHEIAVLERVRDPGIVALLEHGEESGVTWYAMERVGGGTLGDFLGALWKGGSPRAGAGRLPELLALVHRLCLSLGHLHDEGLVHLDLKPANVSLRAGEPPRPVLLDFGNSGRTLALSSREVADFRHHIGTPGYAAPEQLALEPTDSRADLYSIGCILFEAVAGRPVFAGEGGSMALARQHLLTPPPRLGSLVAGVPAALDALVQQLLAKRPQDRLSTTGEVAETLEMLLGAAPRVQPRARPLLFRPSVVGRDAVLERFGALVARTTAGQGTLFLVRGESGMGKTTLAREFCRRAAADFHVIGNDPTQGESSALRPLAAAIAQLGPGLRSGVLGALQAAAPGTQVSREQIYAALRQGISRLSREQPLLLVFDDLQWADELTLGFLSSLPAGWLREHRALLVGLARSEDSNAELASVVGRADVEHVSLGRLEEGAQAELIADALAMARAPRGLVEALVPHAEGNPFFLMELLRLAVHEDREAPAGSSLWSSQWSQHFAFPATLQALVERRLDGLSPTATALVNQLSLLGRHLPEDDLALLPSSLEASLGAALLELTSRQVLEPVPQGGFRFIHDKLREVAAARLSPATRAAMHGALARACEERPAAAPRPAFLAHHWRLAGDEASEFRYAAPAGEACLLTAAYAQAAEHFRRALALAQAGAVPDETRGRWHLQLARAEFGAGRLERAEEHALTSLALSGFAVGGSPGAWRWLLLRTAAVQAFTLAGGGRWLRVAGARRARAVVAAEAALLLTQRYFYTDDVGRVVTLALLASTLAERAGVEVPLAHAALAALAGFVRAHGLASRYFARARQALASTNPSEAGLVSALEALAGANAGRWEEAGRGLSSAEEALRAWTDPHMLRMVLTTRGHLEYFSGDHERALHTFEEVLSSAREDRSVQHSIWARFSMARSLRRLGRSAEALELLLDARAGLVAAPELQSEIICLGVLAAVHLECGDRGAAQEAALAAEAAISRARPTSFVAMEGYQTTALTLVALSRTADPVQRRALLAATGRVVRAHRGLARLFPVARATLEQVRGALALALDQPARARRAFERARVSAHRFGMKADVRDALRALGRDQPPGG